MSSLNLSWLRENMPNDPVIFDIGCADLHDTIQIKNTVPSSTVFAFECSNNWPNNGNRALEHGINYFNMAMSDSEGVLNFYPSGTLDGQTWPWSGSVCSPAEPLINDRWTWQQPYQVKSTTLNSFCKEHGIKPDFIHIDAQGAEYKIFLNLDPNNRPLAIWAETTEFQCYNTGVTLGQFNELMSSLGYNEFYKGPSDSLYVLNGTSLTAYEES